MKIKKVFLFVMFPAALLFPKVLFAGCPKALAALKSVLANKSTVGVDNDFWSDGSVNTSVSYTKFDATGLLFITYDDSELTQVSARGVVNNYDPVICKGDYESSGPDVGQTDKGTFLFRESGTEIDYAGTRFFDGIASSKHSGTIYLQKCPKSPSFLNGKRFTVVNVDAGADGVQAAPSALVGRFTSSQTYTTSDPSTGRQTGQGQFTYVQETCSAVFTESLTSGGVSSTYIDGGNLFFRDNGDVIESVGATVTGGTRTGRMSLQ